MYKANFELKTTEWGTLDSIPADTEQEAREWALKELMQTFPEVDEKDIEITAVELISE